MCEAWLDRPVAWTLGSVEAMPVSRASWTAGRTTGAICGMAMGVTVEDTPRHRVAKSGSVPQSAHIAPAAPGSRRFLPPARRSGERLGPPFAASLTVAR
jgi:hypothetical protein